MGPKPAPPPRPAARPGARPGARGAPGGGGQSWLAIMGGFAIIAGVLGLIYKLYMDKLNCNRKLCPKIDPKVLKWPIEEKTWFPWSKFKTAWSSLMKYVRNEKSCPLRK